MVLEILMYFYSLAHRPAIFPISRPTLNISVPPVVRDGTPIKCSFWVENLQHVKTEAEAAGGATKPVSAAWRWRGQLHLDGHDPEGNVVQFRTRVA